MVDIHSHILWGLDDGPVTLEQSVAMLRLAAESGTTDIVATPHANHRYPFQPELIRERIAELQAACDAPIAIHAGCDFHLSFGNIEDCLLHPTRYTVNGGRYLMVEFPDEAIPPQIGHAFDRMVERGIQPVITHPERHAFVWREPRLVDGWIEAGCLLQVTAQSLDGGFGRTARATAMRLMGEEKVSFVASDGHDLSHRPPRLDTARKRIASEFGDLAAQALLEENPRRVTQNEAISPGVPTPEFRRSGGLWKRLLRF